MAFFHWVSLYANILANLFGEDREEAVVVMDNDAKFDKWLLDYQAKKQREASKANKGGNKRNVSQEEYLAKHAKVYGGTDG